MPHKVAILYQALPPPVIGGQKKKPRVGGYSDSGADIGFNLSQRGFEVVTPQKNPDPNQMYDWVFPDTEEGILSALERGANTIWANTVLFSGHPVEKIMHKVKIVGQLPSSLDNFDDKYLANQLFKDQGLPVAASFLVGRRGAPAEVFLDSQDWLDGPKLLEERGLKFPVIAKPVRGRGSQGVTKVDNNYELNEAVVRLLDSDNFGNSVIIEEYLDGQEITVSVLPPGTLQLDGSVADKHWSLTPAVRVGHRNGVVPFNGDVLISDNSRPMTGQELNTPEAQAICRACEQAAKVANARASVRIDCRLGDDGVYRLFDFNMKPSMTGPGRPNRDREDSLTSLSASAHGWGYADLLTSLLNSAWNA